MMDDPVYQAFILPDYRQEKIARKYAEQRAQQVEKAEQLAKTEAQRVEQVEAEIARLKALLAETK